MQAKLFCIFISPAQRFKSTNRNSVKNRLSETMFSNFCYDWPEATPYPPDIRRISAGHPPDIRRTSAGYPPDIRRISAGSPPDIRRISAGCGQPSCGQPGSPPAPVVTKIRKHSFAEAVFNRVSICAFKTLCRRNKKGKKRRLHYVLRVITGKLL